MVLNDHKMIITLNLDVKNVTFDFIFFQNSDSLIYNFAKFWSSFVVSLAALVQDSLFIFIYLFIYFQILFIYLVIYLF